MILHEVRSCWSSSTCNRSDSPLFASFQMYSKLEKQKQRILKRGFSLDDLEEDEEEDIEDLT